MRPSHGTLPVRIVASEKREQPMLKDCKWMAAALAGAMATPAMADSLQIDATSTTASIDMTWRGRGAGEMTRITHDGRSMRVFAGDLRYQFSRGEGAAKRYEGEHSVLRQSLTSGSARSLLAPRPGDHRVHMGYESTSLAPAQRAAIAATLARADGAVSPAAAQLAVWEIAHDFGDLDIRSGAFSAQADEELLAQVDDLLASARSRDALSGYISFGSESETAVMATAMVAVPLPAPLALAGVGLGIAACVARRRARD